MAKENTNTKKISKTVTSNKSTKNPTKAMDSRITSNVTQSSSSYAKGFGGQAGMTKGVKPSIYPQMAGFGERFLAFLLDGFIVGFASGIIGRLLFAPFVGSMFVAGSIESAFPIFATIPFLLLSLVSGIAITTLYYGYFYINKNGQSLGKKVLNIKVVKTDLKSQLTWGDTFLREIIGKNFLNRFVFYLGYLWYYMSPKRQTWADSIAQTYVVKADSSGKTLMGGLGEYPKKPLITFSGCGCLLLWVIVIVGVIVAAIVFGAQEFAKESQKQKNTNTEVDYRINYQNDGSEDLNDVVEEFKKAFEEEYNKSQQENSL